ncbi:hypothetical protein [Mucilaginibacter sp. HD30]
MRVILPFRPNENSYDIDFCDEEYERFVKDLPGFSSNADLIKLLDDNEQNIVQLRDVKFEFILGNDNPQILELKAQIPELVTDWIDDFLIIDFVLERELNGMFIVIRTNSYLKRLSVLINLTYGATINFLHGVILSSNGIDKTNVLMNNLDFAYLHAKKIGWPPMTGVKLMATISWMNKYEINFYSSSRNSAGRAINAFTHLFSYEITETDSAHLFWCMLGLESLFAQGTQNISEQLRQKISLVHGEPLEFKKKLNALYAFRSRLIHGDLNFPAKFSIDHENYEEGYWDYVAFAASLLLASIKILIQNDLNEFKFTFTWTTDVGV